MYAVAIVMMAGATPAVALEADTDFDPSQDLEDVPTDWGYTAMGTDGLSWSPLGDGIRVAVIEGGTVDGDAGWFNSAAVEVIDVVLGDNDPVDNEHATAMAALIAGIAVPDQDFPGGVAPRAQLVSYPIGDGGVSELASAVRAATDHGVDVINMSIGSQCADLLWIHYCNQDGIDEMQQAIDYARDHDVLVVAAAGNAGPPNKNRQSIPVVNDGVIAVSGMTPGGAASPYQDASEHTDVRASGHQWIPAPSTLPDDRWGWANGTSGASAMTSGLAAVLLSAGYTPDEIEAALLATGPDQLVTVADLLDRLGPTDGMATPQDDVVVFRDLARARSTIRAMINYQLPSNGWFGRLRRSIGGSWTGTVKRVLVTDFQHPCNQDPSDRATNLGAYAHRYSMTATVTISPQDLITMTPNGDVIHDIGPSASGGCGSFNFPFPLSPPQSNWARNGAAQTAKALDETINGTIDGFNPTDGGSFKIEHGDAYITIPRPR